MTDGARRPIAPASAAGHFVCPRCTAGPELLESTGREHHGRLPRVEVKCCGCGHLWLSAHSGARLAEIRRRRRTMTPAAIREATHRQCPPGTEDTR